MTAMAITHPFSEAPTSVSSTRFSNRLVQMNIVQIVSNHNRLIIFRHHEKSEIDSDQTTLLLIE